MSSGSSSSPGCSDRSRCSRRSGSTPAVEHGSPASPRPGRSARGCCSGCSASGIVWLVELPFRVLDLWWARRYDLTEAGYLEWVFGHWFELGAAFVSLCVALLIVMFLARSTRRDLVDARRRRVRRDRGVLRVRAAVSPRHDAAEGSGAATVGDGVRAQAGRLGDPDLGRGRQRHDEPGERVRRRLRGVAEGRALEHDGRRHVLGRRGQGRPRPRDRSSLEQPHPQGPRLVRPLRAARRLGADARDAAPRRDGRGGCRAPCPSRRRGPAARACAGPVVDQPADGGRGRLEGAADDPRSAGRPRPLRRLRDDVAREPRPARLGARAARQPPDAGAARRDGRGVATAQRDTGRRRAGPVSPTSACTRAPSRPRAASGGRRGR